MRLSENQKAGPEPPDFVTLLEMLARPQAFPDGLIYDEITLRQTHASAVLLTRDHAYKLKKPKNFGFFDYSTPALRRHFCAEEVRLNARLAPDVYLGVAPVLLLPSGEGLFGPLFPPGKVPEPGTVLDSGQVIDYAVVMVRLPDEATLEAKVQAGTATPALLAEVARYIAAFHRAAQTDARIASFGERQVIEGNWEENFTQSRPYVGRALDTATYQRSIDAVHSFLDERAPLFASRVREGCIRDCHGDLRLQHVYIRDEAEASGPRLAVVDCIEFNERFRYSDVTAEIAFLTMELDAAGRSDLSQAFVDAYVREMEDEALRELLPFYECYRAWVRGKVAAFQLDEPEVPAAQRDAALQQARALFSLAAHYLDGSLEPTLLLVGGVMGSGKSTLAARLQQELGWALYSSDTTRKRLAGLQSAQPEAAGFGAGIYSRKWTARTYEGLLEGAREALAAGRSVILDASFLRRADRLTAAHLAQQAQARAVFVECLCPREVTLERLARRWATRVAGQQEAAFEASRASDGRPELYEAQRTAWEVFSSEEAREMRHLQVSTDRPLAFSIEQTLEELGAPRFACWPGR